MDEDRERDGRAPQQIDGRYRSAERAKPVSLDTLIHAVANEHRRAILNSLNSASDKTLEFDTLVDRVADRLQDEGLAHVSDEHRQRVEMALHHTHLPKLEEVRIIDYDTETEFVQYVCGELEQDLLTRVEPTDAVE